METWYIFDADDRARISFRHKSDALATFAWWPQGDREGWYVGEGLPDTFDDPANIIAEAWS